MLVFVSAVAAALVISFLCSVSEAVLLTLRHTEIEGIGPTPAARILRSFKREIDIPIAAILIVNTVANTAGASVAGASFVEVWGEGALWIFTLTFTLCVLLFAEIIPKTLGVTFASSLASPVAYGVRFFVLLLAPMIALTRLLSGAFRKEHRAPITSHDELRLLATMGSNEGVVRKNVAEMIQGAVGLRELRARDIMVPRGGMAMLSRVRTLSENLQLLRDVGHSRFPFTEDGDPDAISGIVLAKDLLFQLTETPNVLDWDSLVGKALMVPESAPLETLLDLFRSERRHMAIVVDEYGGTQGLVTLEDILEEIVGEIEDEKDRADTFMARRHDGVLVCRGWAQTRKVFEAIELDEDTDSVSLGGYLSELAGRMPRRGDVLEHAGVSFRITAASPQRVERVEVTRIEKAE